MFINQKTDYSSSDSVLSLPDSEKAILLVDVKNKRQKRCSETLDDGFEDAFQYAVIGDDHHRLKSTERLEGLNQDQQDTRRRDFCHSLTLPSTSSLQYRLLIKKSR